MKLYERLADELESAARGRYESPAALAQALDHSMVITPALQIINEALVDVDAGRCERLIISLAPQEGKSTLTSRFGLLWFLMQNPERRIALVSYGDDIASNMSYAVRNDITTFNGDEGMIDVGLRLRHDSKAQGRWRLAGHNGGVFATGIGATLTGRAVELMLIDDPVKDYRAADSVLQSELAWQWWQTVGRPRLAPHAPVILVMTRWSEVDLAGRLLAKQAKDEKDGLENYDRWRVVNIPAQADHRPEKGEKDPLGRAPGEFMVSARGRTREQWEATKAATTARFWSALYQGKPSPDEGELFKRQFWRRYDLPKAVLRDDGTWHCPGADEVIQSWDMAFKDKNSSDFVVGQVWARFGLDAYLLDEVHERLSFTATCEAVKAMTGKWPQATAKLVEDKANGTAVIDQLRSTVVGLIPVNPTDSKWARAVAVSPIVESGHVHVPTDRLASWASEFVDDHAKFPNASHDDRVDAMTQAITRLLGGQRGPVTVSNPASLQMRMPAIPIRSVR